MLETVLAPAAASLLRVPLPRTSQDQWTSPGNIEGPDRKSTPDSTPNFSGIIRDVQCSFVSSQDRCRTNMQSCQPPGFWSACLHEKCKPSLCLFCTDSAFWLIQERWWNLGTVVPGGQKNPKTSALLKGLKVLKWNHLLVILRHQQAERGRSIWRYSHWCVHCASQWKRISSQSAYSFSNMQQKDFNICLSNICDPSQAHFNSLWGWCWSLQKICLRERKRPSSVIGVNRHPHVLATMRNMCEINGA